MSVSPLLHICFNINQYPDSDLLFYFPYRLKSLIIYQFTQESSLKIQKQFLLLCNFLLGCISFIFTCIIHVITSINICISVLLRFKIGFPNFLTGNVVFIFQVRLRKLKFFLISAMEISCTVHAGPYYSVAMLYSKINKRKSPTFLCMLQSSSVIFLRVVIKHQSLPSILYMLNHHMSFSPE